MKRRNDRKYRKLRAAHRHHCKLLSLGCSICARPIDYTLGWPDPWSYVLHHDPPIASGTHQYDATAFRPAHLRCNASNATDQPERYSRDWLGER